MADGGEKTGDLYAVLGLNKECSDSELRNAYKKLAMRWHPDKCSASGSSKRVEEAKEKFQEIQEAYSVLSDSNKRFLYDVGVYDSDDDHNGMEEFLGEMAQMMSQTKPSEKGHESFEELQQLFVEMFQDDLDAGFGGPIPSQAASNGYDHLFASTSSSSSPFPDGAHGSNKRGSAAMNSGTGKFGESDAGAAGFCFGVSPTGSTAIFLMVKFVGLYPLLFPPWAYQYPGCAHCMGCHVCLTWSCMWVMTQWWTIWYTRGSYRFYGVAICHLMWSASAVPFGGPSCALVEL